MTFPISFCKRLGRGRATNQKLYKFVLLFQGRTGSTYVTERLDAHPRVKMEPEVWGGWGFQIPKEQLPEHAQKQADWLRAYYEQTPYTDERAVGFKTKLDDVIDKRAFISYLRKHSIRIIHMMRRNTVKLVISEINAQRLFDKTNKWNLDNKKERPEPFVLDLDEFDAKLQWREQIENWLASYVDIIALPTLGIYYEELLRCENDFFQKIYNFLEVDFTPTSSKTIKNTPNDLSRIIINYEELLNRYKYTRYEPMVLEI